MKTTKTTTIEKLKTQREKLVAQVKHIDVQMAWFVRATREAEQRELVKLIQSRGISVARLSQILDATSAAPGASGDAE